MILIHRAKFYFLGQVLGSPTTDLNECFNVFSPISQPQASPPVKQTDTLGFTACTFAYMVFF
jgi:hypothetical protein